MCVVCVCVFKLERVGYRIVKLIEFFLFFKIIFKFFLYINVNVGFSKLISKVVI